MAARKTASRVKTAKKAGKKANKPSRGHRGGYMASASAGILLPRKLPVEPKNVTVVYGMHIEPEAITRAAIEAYNKKKYTVHDVRLTEYIPDPKFRNLMVKIAVLDRIQEELMRIYPDVVVIRPNTVTLMVR